MNKEPYRQRYWARSFRGFTKIQTSEPNGTHLSIKKLQSSQIVNSLITQNVDGLHKKVK